MLKSKDDEQKKNAKGNYYCYLNLLQKRVMMTVIRINYNDFLSQNANKM